MRTFVLFALTLAGTAALTDDASAFGKRRHRGNQCCSPTPSCCGTTGVGYGGYGNAYGAYGYPTTMYPGGVYQSGYYTPGMSGTGVIPAAGTIDPKTGLPVAPRTVPNPMPDREKPDRDK